MERGIGVCRGGWGSSRDTDERKSEDATECSELYKCVSCHDHSRLTTRVVPSFFAVR